MTDKTVEEQAIEVIIASGRSRTTAQENIETLKAAGFVITKPENPYPSEPGWYWIKIAWGGKLECIEVVRNDSGALVALRVGHQNVFGVSERNFTFLPGGPLKMPEVQP